MTKEIRNVYDLLRVDREMLDLPTSEPVVTKADALGRPLASAPISPVIQQIEDAQFLPMADKVVKEKDNATKNPSRFGLWSKDYVKYPVIFVLSFVVFYGILNYGAFFARVGSWFEREPKPVQIEGTVLGIATPEFTSWIGKYFYRTNNPDVLSPNIDFDHDGLTNYQEFLLGTNPAKKDTDNDFYNDGQEILNGYNPLYEGLLTTQQKAIIGAGQLDLPDLNQGEVEGAQERVEQAWDLREVNNRIAYYSLTELAAGPAKPSSLPAINYDLATHGEINIPKLGVKAPIIWSKDPANFADDLDKGLIHYPGTSFPGQAGTSYISGHSSNYAWRRSDYSYVFTRINELEPGDEFFITVRQTDGSQLNMRYVVFSEQKYKPDDQAQFEGGGSESIVNLSTCWPIGSIAERYVVSAKLTGI